MSRLSLTATRKELLRHLREHNSFRSPEGENRIGNFILAAQAAPSIRRLCLTYAISFKELCSACTEILEIMPLPTEAEGEWNAMNVFCDAAQLEVLLKKIHLATHGQTDIQRRLAIVASARKHAAQLAVPAAKPQPTHTRSNQLKLSIRHKLPVIMICTGIIILGILLAAYLL